MLLSTNLEALPKIGKVLSAKLNKLEIRTIEDLLWSFPFRYDDFSQSLQIADLQAGEKVNISGHIEIISHKRSPRRRMSITEAMITDDSGMIKAIWFNQPFIAKNLQVGDLISLSGKVEEDFAGLYFASPVYEKMLGSPSTGSGQAKAVHTQGLVPNYHLTAGLTQKQLRFWLSEALKAVGSLEDWLDADILQKLNLLTLNQAVRQIHFPSNAEILAQAKRRLAFDELLTMQLRNQLVKLNQQTAEAEAIAFSEQETKSFVENLPYALTGDQKKSAWEIILDLDKTKPMMRLLQGDVGSGKTIVALLAMYNVVLAGKQAIIMAPTEILASQHYKTITKLLAKQNIKVGLLTSSQKLASWLPAEENVKTKKIAPDTIIESADIIIGTHALIQQNLSYSNLGLVIIDEQHRFGVEQRKMLSDKASQSGNRKQPHLLSMTATPIPRTLALTLYDDLAVSQIKEKPASRIEIETLIFNDNREDAYKLIKQEITAGHQVFIVCPLIDPNDLFGAKSVKEEHERLTNEIFPDISIGLLHGKLKPKEKNNIMASFSAGEIKILVATAVVEVGVDVPNATVMMIESADRFGLAQLHQYRGRVGRGVDKSYCLLMSENGAANSQRRLEAMLKFSSGFDLAKEDLNFRGPGEVFGILQKGFPELRIATLFDTELVNLAKKTASELIGDGLAKRPKIQARLKEELQAIHFE